MTEIGRREFIGLAGAAAAGFALPSFASAQPAGPAGAGRWLFFTPAEAAFVEAAGARLIPDEPEWAGARGAGVTTYIDLQLAGAYGQGDRLYLDGPIRPGTPQQGYQLGLTPAELYRRSLAAIAGDLKTRGLDFAAAEPQAQDDYLKSLEAGDLAIGDFGSAVFFETLLANTIEGYFADPAYGGNRGMVSWRMIGFPGAYAAYVQIYTQHGLRFDREPISMADQHHASGSAPAHSGHPRSVQP
jgi:gluconate 2-dehydrogenase gamma chain